MPGNSAFRSKPTIGNASPNTGDAQAEVARSRSGQGAAPGENHAEIPVRDPARNPVLQCDDNIGPHNLQAKVRGAVVD